MYGNLLLFFVYAYSFYSAFYLKQNILLHKGFLICDMSFFGQDFITKKTMWRMISIILQMVILFLLKNII